MYANDGDIFIVDGNAADAPIQITDDDDFNQQPVFSPDGRSIAFVSDRDGDNEIYIMRLDGANVRALTENEVDDDSPAWAPDSTQVVFSSTITGNRDVFSVDVFTGSLRQLTTDPAADTSPQVSPDGAVVMFMSDRTGNWDIFFRALGGGSQGQIVALPDNQQFPEISIDGTTLLYSSDRTTDNTFQIVRVPLANNQIGGPPEQVTFDEGTFNTLPALSPTGTIAFVRVENNVPTIRRLDFIGGASTELVQGTDPHFYPLTE